MANDHGITPGGVLLAFIAGAAVGAAVALLFAPATGEQTRDYLGQRAREGRERATEAARQGRDMLNRQRDNISTRLRPRPRAQRPRRRASAHGGAGRVNDVFLGTIAAAVLVMAVIQVAAMVLAARAARRVGDAMARLEQDVRPIVANLQAMSSDAARAAGLAAAQVERADQLLAGLRERIDETVQSVQETLLKPLRDAMMMVEALKDAFFGGRDRPRSAESRKRQSAEEEDALFIG